jgi:hypothetical protein
MSIPALSLLKSMFVGDGSEPDELIHKKHPQKEGAVRAERHIKWNQETGNINSSDSVIKNPD